MFQENLTLMEKVRTSLNRSCALSIQLDIEELSKKGQMVRKFSRKISGKSRLKIVDLPKCESWNRKFWKSWVKNKLERKLSLINFRKFGYTTRDCPFLRKFPSIYTGLSRVEDRKEGALIAIYGHRFGRGKSLASCNTIILYPREDESGNSPAI